MTFELVHLTSTPKPRQSRRQFCGRKMMGDMSLVHKCESLMDVLQPDAVSLDVTSLLGDTSNLLTDLVSDNKKTTSETLSRNQCTNINLTSELRQQVNNKLQFELSEECSRKDEILTKVGNYLSKNKTVLTKRKSHKRLVKRFSIKNLIQMTKPVKESHARLGKEKTAGSHRDFHNIATKTAVSGFKLMSGLSIFDMTSYIKDGNKCTWC